MAVAVAGVLVAIAAVAEAGTVKLVLKIWVDVPVSEMVSLAATAATLPTPPKALS